MSAVGAGVGVGVGVRVAGGPPQLTVLIPIHNEHAVLPLLYQRLTRVLDGLEAVAEILFIDDGSRDGSRDWLDALSRADERVAVLKLSRRFGKEAAVTAGLDRADGDAVVLMDGDLQDPPELIPDMLQRWREGYDVVVMRRGRRDGERWAKRATAAGFYRLLDRVSEVPVPQGVGDFRLLSRRAVLALRELPERNRYMKGLFAWIGMPTCEIEFDRPPRAAGETHWPWRKLIGLAADGIFSFSIKPLRLASVAGALSALLALVGAVIVFAQTLVYGHAVPGFPTLIIAMLFIGGIQLLALGILGEYIGRIYTEVKQRPVYLEQSYTPARLQQALAAVARHRQAL